MATDARQGLTADIPAGDSRQLVSTDHPWSAEELFDYSDPPWRFELVDGELYRIAPTGDEHGLTAGNFFGWLFQHVKRNGLGELFAAETGYEVREEPRRFWLRTVRSLRKTDGTRLN